MYPRRVRFHELQYLHAQDLRDEQDYHVQMRRRHNLALHSWGIIAGLELRVSGDQLVVAQGMAIDGYGRELVFAHQRGESLRPLDPSTSYEVWLEYRRIAPQSNGEAYPRRGCAVSAEADRWVEEPKIELRKRTERRSTSPEQPDEVPAGDRDFGPAHVPPDDHARKWPVYLGRLDYRSGWVVDDSERRYAGLVAERIVSRRDALPKAKEPGGTAPSTVASDSGQQSRRERTVIVNGREASTSAYRFAVRTEGPNEKESVQWIAVRDEGDKQQIELRAKRVQVGGDLILKDGAAVEFPPNPFAPKDDLHAKKLSGSEHWRMYHHFHLPAAEKVGESQEKPATFSDEFRVTMPATPAGTNRVVIGCFSEGKFERILVVKDDRSVEVYGTLTVNGRISPTPMDAPAGTAVGTGGPPDADQLLADFGTAWNANRIRAIPLVGHLARNFSLWEAGFAEAVSNREKREIEALVEELWKSGNATGRQAIAASAGSVTDGTKFKEGFLDHLPSSSDGHDFVQFMGSWMFDNRQIGQGRGTSLAKSVPPDSTNERLVEFAQELIAEEPPNRLKALLTALIDASADAVAEAIIGSGKLDALVDALIDAGGAEVLAKRLVAKETEGELVAAMSEATEDGWRSTALTAVGQALPSEGVGLVAFVAALVADTDRAAQFASELLNPLSTAPLTPGQTAVATAFNLEGVPAALADIPKDSHVRAFFRGVATTTDFLPLSMALTLLVRELTRQPPPPIDL